MKTNIAPGHNPKNLTVAQVGEGYRLLDRDEIGQGLDSRSLKEIEAWMASYWDSSGWAGYGWAGACASNVYRTKLSRKELARLRESALKPKADPTPEPTTPASTAIPTIYNRVIRHATCRRVGANSFRLDYFSDKSMMAVNLTMSDSPPDLVETICCLARKAIEANGYPTAADWAAAKGKDIPPDKAVSAFQNYPDSISSLLSLGFTPYELAILANWSDKL